MLIEEFEKKINYNSNKSIVLMEYVPYAKYS